MLYTNYLRKTNIKVLAERSAFMSSRKLLSVEKKNKIYVDRTGWGKGQNTVDMSDNRMQQNLLSP